MAKRKELSNSQLVSEALNGNNNSQYTMNNCKHFDFDNFGNGICLLGGACDNPANCRMKETSDSNDQA